jgi:hypothetical protein
MSDKTGLVTLGAGISRKSCSKAVLINRQAQDSERPKREEKLHELGARQSIEYANGS